MKFGRFCYHVIQKAQNSLRLLNLEADDMLGEGLVDKDCLLTGARVDTNNRMYCLNGGPAEDTTTPFLLEHLLGLFHSRMKSSERLEISPKR